MSMSPEAFHTLLGLCVVSAAAAIARAQRRAKPFEPTEGQRGKDVVWVPTPPELVERMLDIARVTPQDYVIDLGSGDGRNVIAAAKRGAHALGIEYSAQMVEVSRHTAVLAGVADRALFVQGDLYEADISHATVLALFLLPENLGTLSPKFLELAPGTRIVTNRFAIEGWEPDEISRIGGDSASCCTALLYVVPAKAGGRWRLADGELVLEQRFQMLSGTALLHGTRTPIENGRLRGAEISFRVQGDEYVGRVMGDVMKGQVKGHAAGEWSAMRIELTH
jgi:SAM-dependent methyltransferase